MMNGYTGNYPYQMYPPAGAEGNVVMGQGQTNNGGLKKRVGNLIRLSESQVDELNKVYLKEQLTENDVLY